MKKYVLLALMCFPMMSFGASSVRTLGSNAVVGASGTTASKITPVKASNVGSVSGSGVARVGSLRAKATTVNTPSAVSGTTTRFPVVSPTRLFNTAMAPRPTGSVSNTTIVNTDADIGDLTQRVENIENKTGDTIIVDTINNNTTNISDHANRIEVLENGFNSVRRISGSAVPPEFAGTPGTTDKPRAWIWVEE